jgi:excisionase family DNA binding protein
MTSSIEPIFDPQERLLRVTQVADRLQVSPRTIWRLIEDGRISVIRIGRSVRVHPDAVTALLNNSK